MAKQFVDLIGQKFDMLTVTRQAGKDGRYIAWYCDCDCGATDVIVRDYELKRKGAKSKSCGCIEEAARKLAEEEKRLKREEKERAKRLAEQEALDWDELYQYVRHNVMGYDEDQSLSKPMVLRLKGLLTNKFMENKNIESTANYSYETILNAFKYSSFDIQKALRTNSFKDEQHKFNYILKIVEKNINDVYVKMRNIEKAKEEAKKTMVEVPTHTGAEFKPREKKKDRFSDLW